MREAIRHVMEEWMSSDPFERGRMEKEKELELQRAKLMQEGELRKAAIKRLDPILRSKFVPHGYYYNCPGGLIQITPFIPHDDRYLFELRWEGAGYEIRDNYSGGGGIWEKGCSEDRALELAGNFFAKTIDSRQREDKKREEALNEEAQKRARDAAAVKPDNSMAVFYFVLAAIAVIVTLVIAWQTSRA